MSTSTTIPGPSPTPLRPPPPGVESNFVDPESGRVALLTLCSVMLALVLVFVSGRLYHSIRVVGALMLDDIFTIAALIITLGWTSLVFMSGATFRHSWDSPISWFTAYRARFGAAQFVLFGPALFFAKAAILWLYRRMLSGSDKKFRRYIYATMVFCFALYWVSVLLAAILCLPYLDQPQFAQSPDLVSKCSGNFLFFVIQGALNVVLDIWLMVIPFRSVWGLQMEMRKKLGVLAIFLTGALGIVAAAVGLAYRVITYTGYDANWNQHILALSITAEIDVALICGSMPSCAALVKRRAKQHTANEETVHETKRMSMFVRMFSGDRGAVASASTERINEHSWVDLRETPYHKRSSSSKPSASSLESHGVQPPFGIMRSVDVNVSYQMPAELPPHP